MLGSCFTCYRKSGKQTDPANLYTYLLVKLHYLAAAYLTEKLTLLCNQCEKVIKSI